MSDKDVIKAPRLYVTDDLAAGTKPALSEAQSHYLRTVMRCEVADILRLFNGRDGEWLATIESLSKKEVILRCEKSLRPQPSTPRSVHLLFTPIKKDRLDFLIEKAVELGATDLHPVVTQNTAVRAVNEERLRAQIIEAAEQCERLDVPSLHTLQTLPVKLQGWSKEIPLLACIEREEIAPLATLIPASGALALLVGPEGGFTEAERQSLHGLSFVKAVSLGDRILRAETAALCSLSLISTQK